MLAPVRPRATRFHPNLRVGKPKSEHRSSAAVPNEAQSGPLFPAVAEGRRIIVARRRDEAALIEGATGDGMKGEILLERFERSRGFLRDLPENELLTLVGRLATEYLIRRDGDREAAFNLHESIASGIGIARAILEAQSTVLASADRSQKN